MMGQIVVEHRGPELTQNDHNQSRDEEASGQANHGCNDEPFAKIACVYRGQVLMNPRQVLAQQCAFGKAPRAVAHGCLVRLFSSGREYLPMASMPSRITRRNAATSSGPAERSSS